MSETCNIVLTGELLPGHQFDDVVAALAKVLKTSEQRAAACLAGKETTIKRDVPMESADRYLKALQGTGAQARLVANTPPVPEVPPVRVEPSPPAMALAPEAASIEQVVCPQCAHPQPKRTLCLQCGCDMPRVRAAQEEAKTDTRLNAVYQAPWAAVEVENDEETVMPKLFGFSLSGRLGRVRYIAYNWAAMLTLTVAGILAAIALPAGMKSLLVVVVVAAIVALWQWVRLTVMRLHDLNLSGKWVLAQLGLGVVAGLVGSPGLGLLVTAVIWLGALALTFWPGGDQHNDYGPPCAPNSTLVVVGAVLLVVCYAAGMAMGSSNALRSYADYRQKAAALGGGKGGGKPLDFKHPVYAQVRMKQQAGDRELEMVFLAKAGSEQDCKVQGDAFRAAFSAGCKSCVVNEPVCEQELPARYSIMFDNVPLDGASYLSMSPGDASEREGRIVFWGLSAQESSQVCGMMQGNLVKMYKGQVRCIAP